MSEGHSFFDREGQGDISRFMRHYVDDLRATRAKGYITLPLGNHDLARLNTRRTVDDLEMIMAFGLTMPGVPFLYYGNEIGMRQLDGLPQIEGAYKPRAGARSPMQWTGGRNLGFSSAEPAKLYLPVDPAPDAPNVAAEESDPDSLLNRVRRLIRLKHTEPALAAYAEFVPLYAKESAYPFVYARASGDEVLLVAFNPAARPAAAEFPLPVPHREFKLMAGKPVGITDGPAGLKLDVPALTYAIYRVMK
jgi:maltose alpha-D-glucosyltransferase/alpha-amylase